MAGAEHLRLAAPAAIGIRFEAQELAVERALVLGQLRLAGVAGRDVEPIIGPEVDASAVVDRPSPDAVDESGFHLEAAVLVAEARDLHLRPSRVVEVHEAVRFEARVEGQPEQTSLALRRNIDLRDGLRLEASLRIQQTHPSRSLGHERAPVRQERDLPRDLEAGGHGLDARLRPSGAAGGWC
jgi:hypothetical protein